MVTLNKIKQTLDITSVTKQAKFTKYTHDKKKAGMTTAI